jgi:RNase adaptor protein for sRNA GlmZ degradation
MTNEKTIVIVSGLPRSGTSLMMKMLEAGGLPLLVDNLREADEDNPKGYYEFEQVKQLKDGDVAWVSEGRGKAIKVVAPLLRYLPDSFDYKILFMRRSMSEILASQKQMLIRRGKDPDAVPDEMIAKVFDKQLTEVLEWVEKSDNIDSLELSYSDMVNDPSELIKDIQTFLDIELEVAEMGKVVDPALYRQRAN